MLDASVGGGESGGTSTERNRPLLSRSARTIGVMPAAGPEDKAASPAKGTMATGMRCAPAPVISIASWAWAAGTNGGAIGRNAATTKLKRRNRKAAPPGLVLETLYWSCGRKRSSSCLSKRFAGSGLGSGEDLRIA